MSEARAHYDVLIALQSDGRDNANHFKLLTIIKPKLRMLIRVYLHHVYASDIWFGKIFSWYRVTV